MINMREPRRAETLPTEVNDKRERFDALPSLEVSTSEVKALGHGEGFRSRVIGWLKQKGVFGEHRNVHKGWNITLSRKGARNVMAHEAQDGKVALLGCVPDLIRNGIYLETMHNDDGTVSHIFAAKATIDGKPSIIGVVVREDRNGKRYYDHAIRSESGVRAETGTRATETTAGNPPENPNTISNIVQKHLKVNS